MTDSDDAPVTRRELQTELRSFRNEVRILVFGALFASQIFNHTNAGGVIDSSIAGVPLMVATVVAGINFWRKSG